MHLSCLVHFVPDSQRRSPHFPQPATGDGIGHGDSGVASGSSRKPVFMDLQLQWHEAINTEANMDGTGYWIGTAGVLSFYVRIMKPTVVENAYWMNFEYQFRHKCWKRKNDQVLENIFQHMLPSMRLRIGMGPCVGKDFPAQGHFPFPVRVANLVFCHERWNFAAVLAFPKI